MKTLKEELQEIVNEKKIEMYSMHICNHIKQIDNIEEFQNYFEMSKKYASKMHTNDIDYYSGWWDWNSDNPNHLIREKYRFIKDLIAIL